jgi:hypothetical protein
MKSWEFVYKETEYVGQGQNFQRRRRSRLQFFKEWHVVYSWWSSWYSQSMSVAPVSFDLGSHDALVIG